MKYLSKIYWQIYLNFLSFLNAIMAQYNTIYLILHNNVKYIYIYINPDYESTVNILNIIFMGELYV